MYNTDVSEDSLIEARGNEGARGRLAGGSWARGLRIGAVTMALVLFGLVRGVGQIPDYLTEPENGGTFSDKFTITFLEAMQETIALDFSGTGEAEFNCGWFVPIPGFPRMILECTPNGPLPPNSTVTWTLNPGGTGFTTQSGRVLPTSSGTFLVTDGGGEPLTVTPSPANQGQYDPTSDGPVVFSFSQEMDETIDLSSAVTFDRGTWDSEWVDGFTVHCTLQSAAEPGETYHYTLAGFLSLEGDSLAIFQGSFDILDGTGGELTVFPSPADGATYNPLIGPVTFTFGTPMDQSVNPQTAITFDQGTWTCSWAFPGVPSVLCTPVGGLANGTYHYTLSGFRSTAGELYPDFSGRFVVSSGTGGGDGVRAPECPELDRAPLPFPKTMAVCGTNFFAWDRAWMIAAVRGTGYAVGGSSPSGSSPFGTLDSVVRLDGQGRFLSGVMAVKEGTELWVSSDLNLLYAFDPADSSNALNLGVYQADSLTPVYERGLAIPGGDLEAVQLAGGQVAVVQDANTTVSVVLLNSSGAVAWAKRYDSASFGAGGLGGSQSVFLRALPTGYLLDLTQTKVTLIGTEVSFASTNILIRLAAGGEVQWAKKYTGITGVIGGFVSVTESGNLILHGSKTTSPGTDASSLSSVLIKLDANGNPVWGREIADLSLSPSSELPGNKLLVMGSVGDWEDEDRESVFGIIDAAGNLERQVAVRLGATAYGFAWAQGDRIRYSLQSGTNTASLTDAVIGSSSLQLDDWTWRGFSRPAEEPFLFPLDGSTDSLFSYFDAETHSVGLAILDDHLQPQGSCALFVDASVEVVPGSLVVSEVTVSVADETVGVTDFVPETQPATIPLQAFTVAEEDFCEGGSGGDPTPTVLTVHPNGSAEVVVAFDTVQGFNYTLERAATLTGNDWQSVEIVPGTGIRVSRTFSTTPTSTYWRAITSRP